MRPASLAGVVLASAVALAGAQERAIVVGAALSQTGPHAEAALGYQRGLELWRDEVNAGGGLLGRPVDLRLLDDGSEAVRAGALYLKLIREDKADLLIGPYGTAATMMAAAEAESARRVMVNGAGASRAVHKRSPRYVFQSAVPYNGYGTGVLELARAQGAKGALIVSRDDPVALEMASAAREEALKLGLKAGDVEVYQPGTANFAPQIDKAVATGVEAWIAFGEVRDAAEMLKSLKARGYAPRLFFARGASDPVLLRAVGQDAEHALGARAYDARYSTPGNERFVKAFSSKYGAAPGLAAAEGYAAGTVLAAGVQRAGSLDQAKLRASLASLELRTVLGDHRVDPQTGEQLAARAAVTQVRAGRFELVWPENLRSAAPSAPYPGWNGRKLLK